MPRPSRQEQAQQLQDVLSRLFRGQPTIIQTVMNDIDITTVGKLMRMDRNKINTYLDDDGNAMFSAAQQDFMMNCVNYINHLQLETGVITDGLFDISGISEESLEDWVDENWPEVRYSAPEARKRATERMEAEAMVRS